MSVRRALPLAVALVLSGCQGAAPVVGPPTPSEAARVEARVAPPKNPTPTDIALVRRGQLVSVGMTADEAFRVFRDPREGGFEDERLPPNFAAPYRARSWEGKDRGFGVITYQDRVVAAMYQEQKASYQRALEFVQVHQDRLQRPADITVPGRKVNFWFWEQDDQRLRVCAFQSGGKDGVKITTAMGDITVLDALNASPSKAREEAPRVDRLMANEETQKNSEVAAKG